MLYSVRWISSEGLTFSRACISIARVRYGLSPQFVEAVMADVKSGSVMAEVDAALNAAVAAVEDAKAALRRAQASERQLRAARGRAAAGGDPRQLALP